MSTPGRPKGEYRSAQHEGCLMSTPGRPKGEYRSAQHEGCLMSAPGAPMTADATPPAQPRNPLHGLTLESMLTALVAQYGWPGLAERIPVRCFASEPSIASSLKFLRKTPWAREKVEGLYLFMQRDLRRGSSARPTP